MVAAAEPSAIKFYNEWHDPQGNLRPHYNSLNETVMTLGFEDLAPRWISAQRQVELDAMTFYMDPGHYRNMPTDFLPRVIPLDHWETIAAGVEQRIRAINHFLVGLYNDGQQVVPDDVIYTSQHFYPEVQGFRPPKDLFVHIYGVDLVHMGNGHYIVLEDNLRVPSGISYQLKSLALTSELFPEFANGYNLYPLTSRMRTWKCFDLSQRIPTLFACC